VQEAGRLHALAQALGALVVGLAAPALGHGLDVAAGAEGASCAGEDDHGDLAIRGGAHEGVVEAGQHLGIEGVEPVRPVHRQRQNTVLDRLQKHLVHFLLPGIAPRHGSIVSPCHPVRKDLSHAQ